MGYKTEKKIPSIILSVFIVLLILVGTIVPAYAAPTQDMMVTDSGEMLSDREEQEVSEMLYSINRQTGIEYLVYTIKSLNGEDIETCANRLFRTAGLGDKEKDNGLLLLNLYLCWYPNKDAYDTKVKMYLYYCNNSTDDDDFELEVALTWDQHNAILRRLTEQYEKAYDSTIENDWEEYLVDSEVDDYPNEDEEE